MSNLLEVWTSCCLLIRLEPLLGPHLLMDRTCLFPCISNKRNLENSSKMLGRPRPQSLLTVEICQIWDWVGCFAVSAVVDVCVWSLFVALRDVSGVQKSLVAQRLPSWWIVDWLGVNFRVTRGQMPKNMMSSTSWPSHSECWPLLGGDGSCLVGQPVLPFGFLPSPGVRAGWGGSTPLWERRLRAPWGAFGVWVSCVFEKIYPFWTCLWKQLGRSQDRFWFLILYSVYSEK